MDRLRFHSIRQRRTDPGSARPDARRPAELWPSLAAFLIIAILWEGIVRLSNTPAYLIPLPSAIIARTITNLPTLLPDALITLGEALGGLFIASFVALAAAILMSRYQWAERALFPLAVAVKVTPMVAIAPLLVIWLGFGPAPKLIIAALLSYFPILSNAMTGFRSVNPRALEFLRSLDASQAEILMTVRLPHALPFLFSAYKVSTTLSVIGAVVAEWVGADRGLGHAIILANANFDMTSLAAGVLVLALMGIGLYLLVATLERQLLFWHESVLTTEVYR